MYNTYNIEFFASPDRKDIIINKIGIGYEILHPSNSEIINFLFDKIKELYPQAFNALMVLHPKDTAFYKFNVVSRFIRCNFFKIDNEPDIDEDGNFKLENVICPLKNSQYCCHYNIICNPKINTKLSKREAQVIKKLISSADYIDIANELDISLSTLNNHINNINKKLKTKSRADIINYAYKNNLI
jgi:DNA-binding CsgD family transcriptional regulator